ncbi:Protein SCAI,Protein SCAI homolog [Lepeophtheirus salmonis]|uniref:Protein SCAI,Protein SCAI homolog n=1 Tax=Lepeophtheirus salmonis TaxID=72036 RepID=A0A7R8HEB0_LEPSM|nr:Protein SCAI,Protein SCAI homolog [Lepeophtheirus salmonis]CAF3044880.1 Protein SCAI,Protein SCAI homolog [Lepeophtheirus salmonis]
MNEEERKIVDEFCHLLEKSKQLFNGLRDMPQYGHKQWQAYFGRTFDIYTKLWKYQQQHRGILDERYGLKRWQIGEVASKIGQLYYHYYLRTSETNYLNEAFSFYAAIRGRSYYNRALREDRPDLMVKKLRYYARFIVVCLLLKKMKLVRDLVRELSKHVDEYTAAYEPDDQLEWSLVLQEIKSFIEADSIVNVLDSDSNSIVLSHRLNPLITPPVEKSQIMVLSLQEAIIVGSCSEQVKFSELTLDMFRMLQTLEREPQEDLAQIYDSSPASGRVPFENGGGTGASGQKELPLNGAIMIYISGEGCFSTKPNPEDPGYDYGGVLLSSRKDIEQAPLLINSLKRAPHVKEANCLYPGDLYAFTRRPTFLIIDSDNSSVFRAVPKHFDQPLVVLMSSPDVPPSFHDHAHKGSLYSLFLHSPLSAFSFVTNIVDIPIHLWDKCLAYVDRFMTEASRLMTRFRSIDSSYLVFLGDDFLRLILCRHIFCATVLRVHRSFRSRPQYHPSSQPPLPDLEIIENPTLQRYTLDLAAQLDVRHLFVEQCVEID